MRFESYPKLITGDISETTFPDRFSNEIYLSELYSKEGVFSRYCSPFSVKYTIEGTETYVVNNHRHDLTKGKMLVVNEGADTIFLVDDKPRFKHKGISFFIDCSLMEDVAGSVLRNSNEIEPGNHSAPIEFLSDLNYTGKNERLTRFIGRIAKQLCREKQAFYIDHSFYTTLAAELVLAHGHALKQMDKTGRIKLSTKKEIFIRITKAKEYLDANIDSPFNLQELALVALLSRYNLIRYFKAITGYTPQQYHLQRKMALAKKLLKKEPVTNVAYMCGYPDIHAFSRQFKMFTGTSPGRLRRIS